MPLALTDVQHALDEAVTDWAARADPRSAAAAVSAEPGAQVALEAVLAARRGLAELGIFGMGLPERLGGGGASGVDVAVAIEAVTRALVPGPVVGTLTAAALLGKFTTEPSPLGGFTAEPSPLGGFTAEPSPLGGFTAEPSPLDGHLSRIGDTGAPAVVIAEPLTGARSAAGLRVDGAAGPVPDLTADSYLVLGVTDGEAPGARAHWFLLPPGHPGVSVGALTGLDFSRPLAELRLTSVALPDDLKITGLTTAHARDAVLAAAAAQACGIAGWALSAAAEYAAVRVQFGKPIGAFQAIKGLTADMLCRSEEATALAWDAAGHPMGLAPVAAVARALDAAVENAKDAIQVLGGIGFTWEHPAHLYLRRALSLRQLLGGSARWRVAASELARSGERRAASGGPLAPPELVAEAAALAALPEPGRRRALADSGLLVPHWPAPYGRGADPATQLQIDAALTAASLERPALVIGAWAAPTILAHGTAAQSERFIWPTLRGEITWCQLFSEPEAGSDLASLRTRAVRADGGWVLTGQKVWTSLAHEADWAICLARTDPDAPKHKGITYFLVDMRGPGIEIRPLREITGDVRFNEVFLTEVFVPDECVVGEVNGGWRLARTTLANERVAMSGGSTLGERLEALIASDDGADDEGLGDLIAEACACAAMDDRATAMATKGRDPGPTSSVRKLIGVRHRQAVAEAALVRLGSEGAVASGEAVAVQYEALLTRCLSIAGGTSQILRNVAAERILGLPRG